MAEMVKILAFILFSIFILEIAFQTHKFGFPVEEEMDNYFIKNSQREVAANNVVTAIVFDYRGFDTLGEATVMFAAIVGVAMLFRKEKNLLEAKDQDA
ncbi:MAG: hydrogen gas-evolving membrane-bound hydrogenase subunit E [Candidatus Altiarchaeota archaeon]